MCDNTTLDCGASASWDERIIDNGQGRDRGQVTGDRS